MTSSIRQQLYFSRFPDDDDTDEQVARLADDSQNSACSAGKLGTPCPILEGIMKAIDRPFTKIIDSTGQFIIPVFQRDYSWSEPQCEQLWNDVIDVGGADGDRKHFMGSVVYVDSGESHAGFAKWLLIDGQQRVTTITLLLMALRRYVLDSAWSSESPDGPTAKRIEAYFLKNIMEDGDRQQKLVLRRRDQDTLHALLFDEEMPETPSRRVLEAYEYFLERMADADPNIVYNGVTRLVVVDVTLDRLHDDPQLVFESLNSTGLDLTQGDLIRNYILMRLGEPDQTRLYKTYWRKIEDLFQEAPYRFDGFARDYLALQTKANKQSRASEIYQHFREFFHTQTTSIGVEGLLEEMLRYARHYARFLVGRGKAGPVGDALARLARLAEASAVLVLRLSECHQAGSLSDSEFTEALELLESYVFRRVVCGLQTRGYWARFSSIAYRIPDEEPLLRLKVELARQPIAYRFPDDEEFRKELVTRAMYGMRTCHFMLDSLENHDNKEPTDTSSFTVEHILPQNPTLSVAWREMLGEDWEALHPQWVHRLGNLTLTGYNSTYSDRPFEEKKTIKGGFSESSVRLNRFVREQPTWGIEQIEARGAQLTAKALEIWGPLEVADDAVSAVEKEDLQRAAARRTADAVPMSRRARDFLDKLRPRIEALGPVIEKGEHKSVSIHRDLEHSAEFFVEILARKHHLQLLIDVDYEAVRSVCERVQDAKNWKFVTYARYSGGAILDVWAESQFDEAIACLRVAYEQAGQ